jgi:hypothetical protein
MAITSNVGDARGGRFDLPVGQGHFAILRKHLYGIPKSVPYRPPRDTVRPTVKGLQSALVVGKSKAKRSGWIKYGRVKVQFYWDRDGQKNETSSCWVACRPSLGRQELGLDDHSAHRPGSAGRFPGRRSGPAHHRRPGLQRRPDAALDIARQPDAVRHPHPQQQGRQFGQRELRFSSRTRRARSRSMSGRKRT